ncbi:MAG TPA: chorismate synthase [Chloroflexota bacterium]|nr:chorismate synthase [Chloroflexota bacterium]
MLRFLTAGESHGPQLTIVIDGFPAGVRIDQDFLDAQLARRQQGHGRSERQKMERDHAEIVGGVRGGLSLGSPICMTITNRVWKDWQERMSIGPGDLGEEVTRLRPGHADLAGTMKYGHSDVRNVLERASARETASRVAVGALAGLLLREFGIFVRSHVVEIGPVKAPPLSAQYLTGHPGYPPPDAWSTLWERVEASPVRCADPETEAEMIEIIDDGKRAGNTWGGVAQVLAYNAPIGLGSHTQWDRRLDAALAAALMSIPSVKGMDIGAGFAGATLPGSDVHDIIRYDPEQGWVRPTNRAGGTEGGISNGEPLIAQVAFKPISTMRHALPSADLHTGETVLAHYERSDTCVVPAGGVVAEAMVAWVVAGALAEKCGGDSLQEMRRNFEGFVSEQQARVQTPCLKEQ